MIGKGIPLPKLLLACAVVATTCLAQAALAEARISPGQAKKAARAAVLASDSYAQIKSPFALRVRGCRAKGKRTICKLYRSVSRPCGLTGGPKPGQVCTSTVAHRKWTVRVTAGSTTIVSTSDAIGRFKPRSSADSGRRGRR